MAFAAVLITASSASATDDWVRAGSIDITGWAHRTASSTVGGVRQDTQITWSGSMDVLVSGGVSDVATDGYCETNQIRYQISPDAGQWSGWHYRQYQPAVDCSTDGEWVASYLWLSRYPTKNPQARACHADSSGVIVECEGTWH